MKFTDLETETKDIFLSKEIHSTKRAKQISRDYQKENIMKIKMIITLKEE